MKLRILRTELWNRIITTGFVEELTDDEVIIEEKKNENKAGQLQAVHIIDVPISAKNPMSWFLNQLEDYSLQGFYKQENARTVDAILVILEEKEKKGEKKTILTVYLIELKSKIDEMQLADLPEKLGDSISRFLFLLSVDEKQQHENCKTTEIKFEGIVFYNHKGVITKQAPKPDLNEIYATFHHKDQIGTTLCKTILGNEKIPLKFIMHNSDRVEKGSAKENIEITYENIKRNY